MHGFALLLGSMLGHSWARELVASVQRIVSYVRKSTFILGRLSDIAKQFNISTTLVTSNKTRFTSVYLCLMAFVKLESALKALVAQHKEVRR